MSTTVIFEGGGKTESTQSILRRGLRAYCDRVNPRPKRLKIVAAGGREEAFDKFKRAIRGNQRGEVFALLVDSEGPVVATSAAQHLATSDHLELTHIGNQRVFLMVQAMESWFLADRECLARFYDGGFVPSALPGDPKQIEVIRKEDVAAGLKNASRNTKKGEYHKINHGAALLGWIDADKVERSSPHAKGLHDFLRTL